MKRVNRRAVWLVAVLLVLIVTLTACSLSNQTTAGRSVNVNLVAKNISFNLKTITVPAGASVTLNFDNQDSGVGHNFALYRDSSAQQSIFIGQIVKGPATIAYNFTAPDQPGSYFFRCDPHPPQMNGTFIVQ